MSIKNPSFECRPIASFGRRRGRKLKSTKQELMDTVLPRVAIDLPPDNKPLNLKTLFGREGECWLEIGFGGGEHLAGQAECNPSANFIGCEPYVNGMSHLVTAIHEKPLKNVRVFMDDARLLLKQLPDACLQKIFILFPDPWPKTRHHKRRLINPDTLTELARTLKPGGLLRLASDHADYGTWMLMHLLADRNFEWTARRIGDCQQHPTDWIPTRYEQKNLDQNDKPLFLDFIRR